MSLVAAAVIEADWEVDYYSRPVVEPDGKKRWELLICSSQGLDPNQALFRWVLRCPAASVNSVWLREALGEALLAAAEQGFAPPRRIRCWRTSMRTMVQRAAESLALEVVASRRCYGLIEWLIERQREVYPAEEGYMASPLAPRPHRSSPWPSPCRKRPGAKAGAGPPSPWGPCAKRTSGRLISLA